jgi:hypothetical protein
VLSWATVVTVTVLVILFGSSLFVLCRLEKKLGVSFRVLPRKAVNACAMLAAISFLVLAPLAIVGADLQPSLAGQFSKVFLLLLDAAITVAILLIYQKRSTRIESDSGSSR